MSTETKPKNVYQKLFDFQKEDLGIAKTKSAHQYKYAPLDDIMEIVKPMLQKHGLIIVHNTVYLRGEGDKPSAELVRTVLMNTDNPEDYIVSETEIRHGLKIGSMNFVMVTGAQITYIRRYHVVTLLGLTTEEDTDVNSTSSASNEIKGKLQTGPDYMKIFENQLKKPNMTKDKVNKSLKNYEQKMEPEMFKNISDMIEEHFKKK